MAQNLKQSDALRTMFAYPRYELVPVWQTEPFAQVAKRERLRGMVVGQIAEPALLLMPALRQLERLEEWGQVDWESYAWEPGALRQNRGLRGAGITTFARRLMAIERATAQRRKPTYLPGRISRMWPSSKRPSKHS